MAARFDNYLTCATRAISVIAAVATTPSDGTQTPQKLQWRLLAITTPEAVATSGMIIFPDSP